MSDLAPIVLFVYNRPEHTFQTVSALQANNLASQSDLIIYSDAVKTTKDKNKVDAVRSYIKTIKGFKSVTIIQRNKNYGLAASIIDGVTTIVNQYGKVIVLEDDLVTSPFFLTFMNDALTFYENNNRVWHISGYAAPLNLSLREHYFIKPTSCWGWATWKDRWSYFKKDSDYYIERFNKSMIRDFNLNGSYDYFSHLINNHKGKINTWAIFWYLSCYMKDGLSLHPKKSFVKNIGHDNTGENCTNNKMYNIDIVDVYAKEFPVNVTVDEDIVSALADYHKKNKLPVARKIINRLLKIKKQYIN